MPDIRVDGRGAHAHQHLVVGDGRRLDVAQLELVGRPVPLLDDRLHAARSYVIARRTRARTRGGTRRL